MQTFAEYMQYPHGDLASIALRAASEQGQSNPCVGPYSIGVCLDMLATGADGNTADSITGLYAGKPVTPVVLEKGRFDCANMVWVNPGNGAPRVKQNYIQQLRDDFSAEVDTQSAAGAAGRINGWVSRKTEGMIPSVMPDDPTRDDACVLVNAVYFLCNWLTQFDKDDTADDTFETPVGPKADRMMSLTARLPRLETADGYKLVSLRYEDEGLQCLFCLPPINNADPVSAAELAASIDIAKLQYGKTIVNLPRFEVEARTELLSPLVASGAKLTIDTGARFPGICNEPVGVSAIHHMAKVKCDETGTEAAAATAATVTRSAMRPQPFLFRADRPFGFAVRSDRNDVPLFVGVVNSPKDPS